MVFYFSGTGNSRFVAEYIARALEDETVDVGALIKEGKPYSCDKTGAFVFVGPIYVSAPARPLTEFIEKSEFSKDVKAYFIMTCASAIGSTPVIAKQICETKGWTYMGSHKVVMPQNYIAYFTTFDRAKNAEIINSSLPEMESISAAISKGEVLEDPKMFFGEKTITKWTCDWYYKDFMKTKKFKVNEGCISCGKCVKGCYQNNIRLVDGKPVWGPDCTHCMACINQCPKGVIEYGKKTAGKPRYHGPEDALKKAD